MRQKDSTSAMNILVADAISPAAVKMLQAQAGWNVILSSPKEFTDHLAGADAMLIRSGVTDLGAARRLTLALAAPSFSADTVAFTDLLPYVYSDYTAQGMWVYSGDWSQIPTVVQNFLAGATA